MAALQKPALSVCYRKPLFSTDLLFFLVFSITTNWTNRFLSDPCGHCSLVDCRRKNAIALCDAKIVAFFKWQHTFIYGAVKVD